MIIRSFQTTHSTGIKSGSDKSTIQKSLAVAHKKGPLRKGLARNDVKGRFSFSLIVNSLRMRQGFESMQYKSFPTTHTWVVSLASEHAKEVIEEKKSLIKEKLVQVLQFSINTDN